MKHNKKPYHKGPQQKKQKLKGKLMGNQGFFPFMPLGNFLNVYETALRDIRKRVFIINTLRTYANSIAEALKTKRPNIVLGGGHIETLEQQPKHKLKSQLLPNVTQNVKCVFRITNKETKQYYELTYDINALLSKKEGEAAIMESIEVNLKLDIGVACFILENPDFMKYGLKGADLNEDRITFVQYNLNEKNQKDVHRKLSEYYCSKNHTLNVGKIVKTLYEFNIKANKLNLKLNAFKFEAFKTKLLSQLVHKKGLITLISFSPKPPLSKRRNKSKNHYNRKQKTKLYLNQEPLLYDKYDSFFSSLKLKKKHPNGKLPKAKSLPNELNIKNSLAYE